MGNASILAQNIRNPSMIDNENPFTAAQPPKKPKQSKRFSFYVDFNCDFLKHPVLEKIADYLPFEVVVEVTDGNKMVHQCLQEVVSEFNMTFMAKGVFLKCLDPSPVVSLYMSKKSGRAKKDYPKISMEKRMKDFSFFDVTILVP